MESLLSTGPTPFSFSNISLIVNELLMKGGMKKIYNKYINFTLFFEYLSTIYLSNKNFIIVVTKEVGCQEAAQHIESVRMNK